MYIIRVVAQQLLFGHEKEFDLNLFLCLSLQCMVMRGVQKVQSKTVTSTMLGVFREDPRTREVRKRDIVKGRERKIYYFFLILKDFSEKVKRIFMK